MQLQINENPQPAMSMQRIMRWGHDFPKDKEVGMLTLNPFGQCYRNRTGHQTGKAQNVNRTGTGKKTG